MFYKRSMAIITITANVPHGRIRARKFIAHPLVRAHTTLGFLYEWSTRMDSAWHVGAGRDEGPSNLCHILSYLLPRGSDALLITVVCWCCGGLPSAGVRCLLVLWGVAICWWLLSAGAVGGCRLLVLREGELPSLGVCCLLVLWGVLLRARASYFLDCENLCYQLRSQEPRDIRCAGGRFCACFICVVCL